MTLADKPASPLLPGARPEISLLLHSARPHLTPEAAGQVAALLRQPLDWENVLRLATAHGARPLLYRALRQASSESVPPAVMAGLQEHTTNTIRRNLFLTGELVKLVSLLESHDIPAVPVKGPVLAETLYGSLALREIGDLDILIHQADRSPLKKLLLAHGYECQYDAHYGYKFVPRDRRVLIEVHWNAAGYGGPWLRKVWQRTALFELDRLWPRLVIVPFAGRRVRNLAPEDLLLVLCVHGAKHRWSLLRWIGDVAALLAVHPALYWDELLDQARQPGLDRMLFLGLRLAQGLLGAELPRSIYLAIESDDQVEQLAAQVSSLLFDKTTWTDKLWSRQAYLRQLWNRRQDRVLLYLDHILRYGQKVVEPLKKRL
ncbi:MAG: nucleotidyltransferase family protein [Chloroflexi bacterium]|nr:nucleotidyltransferase family protein [Chloroflexota bacterium]MCI0648193.1 nucleotidyltransferase family protein [Chloroflexota bacterium]